MALPDSLLMLAGFVFAHATWSVSDLPAGNLLVPLAIVEKSGQRQLLRFEAPTQVQAISEAKAQLQEHETEFDAWAFAREGQFQESGKQVDVITVEAKTKDMVQSVVFVQRFQPFSTGRFLLVGEPMVSIGGKQVSDADAKRFLAQLHAGIKSHGKAIEHWNQWTAP